MITLCSSRIKIVCILVGIFFLSICCAEAKQSWMTYNTTSGLTENDLQTFAVKKEQLAVGSHKGIDIFDAQTLKWYELGEMNKKMTDIPVRCIDYDENGDLWAASPNGLFFIDLKDFPKQIPKVTIFDTNDGLSTVDVEMLQIVKSHIYVGCFGGWIFKASISNAKGSCSFFPVNGYRETQEDNFKIMSVGVTAMAIDFPYGDGIYSTKGNGLKTLSGQSVSELPSDWVNDFWAFQKGKTNQIIAITQNNINLIENYQTIAKLKLPDKEVWITSIVTVPLEEMPVTNVDLNDEYTVLNDFLGKNGLYVATRGQGIWIFKHGVWSNLLSSNSPLPSNEINKLYYLISVKKVVILSKAGLTILGTNEDVEYDEFKYLGSFPFFAKTFWPFMQSWGPRLCGYPDPMYYPIEPFIAYRKIVRSKDLWISHDKGISRFVFPTLPPLGLMQLRYRLASRYANPANDSSKNLMIEDNSVVNSKPIAQRDERIWHHYCKEQPQDISKLHFSEIWMSKDTRSIAGPLNIRFETIESPEAIIANRTLEQSSSSTETVEQPELNANGYRPVTVYECENGNYDSRGKKMYKASELIRECPMHPIVSDEITDFTVDYSERCWAIFDKSSIACLSDAQPKMSDEEDRWHVLSEKQIPWESGTKIKLVKMVAGMLFVGVQDGIMYYLPNISTINPEQLQESTWEQLVLTINTGGQAEPDDIVDVNMWDKDKGTTIAILGEKGFYTFNGETVKNFSVPKRHYTCMAKDRLGNEWLGSFQGLLRISPDEKVHQVPTNLPYVTEKVTAIAAAPDDAKYPFTIAVATDKNASTIDSKFFAGSDSRPLLKSRDNNPYKLSVVNPTVDSSKIYLYDNDTWEMLQRPGVRHLMFDNQFLWSATSRRVMRFYIPVEQCKY